MSDIPFYAIIYTLVPWILILALPVYFLFFRRKRRPLKSQVFDQHGENSLKCPVCGYVNYLPETGQCRNCGASRVAPPAGTQSRGKTPQLPAGQPQESLSDWRGLFAETTTLYRKRFFDLIPLGLTSSIFTCLFCGLLFFVTPLRMSGESYSRIFAYVIEDPFALSIAIVVALAMTLLMFWCQLAFFYAHADQQPGEGRYINRAAARLFPYIGLCLLYLSIVTVGGIFLIVPGVLIALQHVLAPVVFVTDEGNPVDVLRKSRFYVRGRQDKVFPKILALGFFAILAFYSSLLFAIPTVTREAPLPILLPLMAFPVILCPFFFLLSFFDVSGAQVCPCGEGPSCN